MFGAYVLVPRFAEAPTELPPDVAAQVDYGFGATATMTSMYLLPGSLLMLVAGRLRASQSGASAPSGRSRSAWR